MALLAGLAACGPLRAAGQPATGGQATASAQNSGTRTTSPQTAGRTCLTGTLAYDHRDAEAGESRPLATAVARNANWQLWGKATVSEQAQLLASGVTGQNDGTFSACADRPGPFAEAYLKFRSSSTSLWRVVSPVHKTEYSFESPHLAGISASRDLGTVKVPADQQGAWKIVDTLNDFYRKAVEANTAGSGCWTRHQSTGGCDQLTFSWAPDATDGGYWDPGSRDVVLAAEDADSKHTILHEAGHWFHFELYDHSFPDAPNCENHQFDVASSTGCAWTEAFADAVAAYSLGDYRYVFSDGKSFDLHNDRSTTWDRGDAVQGRIGGSLLDLWAKDGPDGGSWNRDIQLMSEHQSADFHTYFTVDRPKAGLATTDAAKRIISSHTIDY